MLKLLPAILLLSVLAACTSLPSMETASARIQDKLERHLFEMPPRIQGHYALRLYRLTGDERTLNAILYDLYFLADRVEAINRGIHRPEFARQYGERLAAALPDNPRGQLRKAAVEGRESYLFYADELLRYLARLDELGFRHPADAHFRRLLRNYSLEPVITDPAMIEAWAAQLANHVWWLYQLGLGDLRDAYMDAFKRTYPDHGDGKLSDQQFTNKVYGLTHMVFAASEYYQQSLDAAEFRWITDYLGRHLDEILRRTKPDVHAEVGIVFLLLGLEDHPAVVKSRRAILQAIDPEYDIILSTQGSADLVTGEHRNVLAWMLLNWTGKLYRGPYLHCHGAVQEFLPFTLLPIRQLCREAG